MSNRLRNHDFYKSRKWQAKRAYVMRKYKYEDQDAKRYGRCVEATMIHHIYPLQEYPELALETWNLLPLSQASHNRMHDRLTDEITSHGKVWQRKRERQFNDYYQRHEAPPVTEI